MARPWTTLNQLLEAGAVGYGAGLLASGLTEDAMFGRLQERFPLATTQTLEAAWRRSLNAFQSANALDEFGPGQRLRLGDYPAGPAGANQFTYRGQIVFGQPGDPDYQVRTFSYSSPSNLTHAEVTAGIQGAASAYYSGSSRAEGSRELTHPLSEGRVDLFSVERTRI